ncbi:MULTISPECIES: aldehyde dehydrogenase family protein [Mycobacterium]|uniref:Aldehyde dehydrogenase n=1 Tax=Mycobacterium kiyosense TaxID=2871094 RepID=A0A9P3UXZ1_9MYCO|nr:MULTISPECIES: aldehyde dehydrogenase family protein [Mycobacterium]BDE11502.1 putative coniferyl aldehyde dehydrogenase [Mycobacterium sp. 20KCMC460]GLB82414.1 putative coniferyl aldehyde dehydrogenase [Mycobacterium kiyosense]GLB88879.1 putative coniferyl aldehyde dehydrogenase [Mycobacterium kiyosense]GLB95629.1 putative coniferyl aldehyde dehydrogenase [Mycobacterium kiyosense]GLC06107.1 putative coniferyl aldehyde dehydrogenase [Mycobacterium kiyosense]
MATIATPKNATDDAAAIAALRKDFAAQRAAFRTDSFPSVDSRIERLQALAGMVIANRNRIRQALQADFAVHPAALADLAEVLSTAGRAQFAIENLEAWMQPSLRETDPELHGTSWAGIHYQPKGVIGIISPWNFPFDLSLGPVVDMLAAGNRAIIKPSELTPNCSELLHEMVSSTFDADLLSVVTGNLELAKVFPTLPWNHLLYTGSTSVGRAVACAAAENLTPVTLELGGKSPAVLLDDGVDAPAVANIVGTKMMKNGQMCIAPDYCLVPRDRLSEFISLAKQHYRTHTPDYAGSDDCTGIITQGHLERLQNLLDEARRSGCEVVPLGEDRLDPRTRRMPMVIVVDPAESLGLMREEIFGPILPVKPYDDIAEAIDYINRGERPLGLYVFGHDEAATQDVLVRTVSGGACVNACGLQGALAPLGFGGVGSSGMGRHHGIDGFREFSNARGVVVRGEGGVMEAFLPPYGALATALVDGALGAPQ